MSTDARVRCVSLSFRRPDGGEVFSGLDFSVGPGRTGLIGLNGCGKSTLIRLIAGELTPQAGTVSVRGGLGHLPQTVVPDTALRVDQVLGIAERRAALDAVESGDVRAEHFAVIGDDWDVEERSLAALDGLGLGHIGLDRVVGEMSGGECVLLRLAALLLRDPGVLLLDEPTNNLDAYARRRLYDVVDAWTGTLLVVSHDRELLERVRGGADRGEPRRAVPGVDRDHPVAAARRRTAGHHAGGGAGGPLRGSRTTAARPRTRAGSAGRALRPGLTGPCRTAAPPVPPGR
ncbi:ATP-binding cassette domain-containing protein, partial [Streptomyces sp. SID10692]|uniref:ATP-binding cassette domain-containing protein n=1 Tax=Streptomyces sp. SID10692 TaxID=2706026 RepID=UPI001EF3179B